MGYKYFRLLLLVLVSVDLVLGQGSCRTDADCSGKFPCCSQYGYCGDGVGYCSDPDDDIDDDDDEDIPVSPVAPVVNTTATEGCFMPNVEIVGGDLSPGAGGGGLLLDRGHQVGHLILLKVYCKQYSKSIVIIQFFHSENFNTGDLSISNVSSCIIYTEN